MEMMLGVEDVLSELAGEEGNERGLPPGFRFHPTDEELITFYLASKVFNGGLFGFHIAEVDLNRCEPWELPEMAKMGEKEWYFFSLRDRKYPTGLRTNRATAAGYWKATGKDKEIFGGGGGGGGGGAPPLLGMKKTLVFYKGRAPRGVKTKWVMHEYRLEGHLSLRHTCKDEWVICRVFNKTGDKKNVGFQAQIHIHHDPQQRSSSSSSSSSHHHHHHHHHGHHHNHHHNLTLPPLLETPQTLTQFPSLLDHQDNQDESNIIISNNNELKTLINPVVSQLSSIIFSSEQDNLVVGKPFMKTETTPSSHNHHNLDMEDYYFHNTMFQEADLSLLGLSPSSAPRDFHVIFDSPVAESWPLDL